MSLSEIAIATALAWGAGLRAYAVIFAVGLAGAMGWVELPGYLHVLEHPLVIGASGFMTLVEFGADPDEMHPDATLEELEIDSLDLFELGQILNQEFGIEVDPDDFENVKTLGEAQAVLVGYLK